MAKRKANNQGFTLLEIVVALAVMSLCITAILQSFVRATSSTRVAGDYYEALQIAETRMALLVAQPEPERNDGGSLQNGFRWQSSVAEFEPMDEDPLSMGSPLQSLDNSRIPYHYLVEVFWGENDERSLQLNTIRLGVDL